MKNILFIISCSGVFVAVFVAYPFYLFFTGQNIKTFSIVSPLPNLLTKIYPKSFQTTLLWKPNENNKPDLKTEKLQITAKSVLAYDLSTDAVLFEKNSKEKLPIASLTKIMTGVVALENESLNKKIKITKRASEIGEDAMGLSEGEVLSFENLLYGLMLHSGNDAAEAIAQASPFGRENFVYLMNKKAENLGLSSTHFTNPTGLEGDGKQYSTAYDLLVITRYALQNPDFARVVATSEYEIPYTRENKAFSLFSETNLLTTYPGVKGVKTGYTDEAGLCLVTYLEYKGHKIIVILLSSENRRREMTEILDYSLKSLGVTPPPHS